jgi:hypothetical protein
VSDVWINLVGGMLGLTLGYYVGIPLSRLMQTKLSKWMGL